MKKHVDKRALIAGLCAIVAIVVVMAAAPQTQLDNAVPVQSEEVSGSGEEKPSETTSTPQTTSAVQASTSVAPFEAPVSDPDPAYVDEDVLRQFEVTTSAESDEAATEPETFVMPEGAEYEPEVALFSPDPNASVDEVNAALATVSGIQAPQVSEEDLEYGLIRVEVAPDASLEDVVNQLRRLSVTQIAQPNFIYTLDDLTESADESIDGADSAQVDSSSAEQDSAVVATEPADQGSTTNDQSTTSTTEAATDDATSGSESAADSSADDAKTSEAGISETQDEKAVASEEAAITEDNTSTGELSAESTSVNDPQNGSQWGLSSIHAREAWDLQKASGKVTVAVLDVGFNVNHEDLKDNILKDSNGNMVVYDAGSKGAKSDVTPFTGASDRNHGNHVAGIIAATANNGIGVAGATYNAKILPVRMASGVAASGSSSVDSSSIWNAFTKVVSMSKSNPSYNIRVINLSMGSTSQLGADGVFQQQINNCYNNNIVVVASAGNSTSGEATVHYPSDYANCVAVMTLAQSGSSATRYSSSNYNRNAFDHKDVCAPGANILSTIYDGYGSLSGSSMATPFASSVLALEYAEANALGKSLSAQEAIDILHATTTDLGSAGWDVYYGFGEVNAYSAVKAVKDGLTAAQKARLDDQAEAQAAEQQNYNERAANSISYCTHIQNIGWQDWKSNGDMSGTSGRALRLEAIKIKLSGAPYSGGIQYRTHVQNIGWQDWKADGDMSGTSGRAYRLEAIEINLTGEMAEHYSVWYRVHCQDYGWLGWTCDGGRSGTSTLAKRLEAIEIRILPKGDAAPGSTDTPYITRQIRYRTHVQNIGWQGWAYDGATAGTYGRALRLEGMNIQLTDAQYSGGIRYCTHVQNIGWQDWRSDGGMSGTTGRALRLEAMRVELYGDMAEHYDVWYCVHAQNIGWMGWAKNGESAGTAGFAYRLEAMQIRLLPKGSGAPGSTADAFRQR